MPQLQNQNASYRSPLRPIPASLAMIGVSLFCLAPASSAQTHTSTSSGGGKAATSSHAASPSLQSTSPARTAASSTARNGEVFHRARGYWRGGVYYPYVVGVSSAADANGGPASSEAECQGGPTVFDRCSPAPAYIAPTNSGPAHTPAGHAPASNSSATASPTTLVFKDGHEVEVDDFAVAGKTLYDLTPGRSQKIALSDLDLNATRKQNPDQSDAFALPPSAHSN